MMIEKTLSFLISSIVPAFFVSLYFLSEKKLLSILSKLPPDPTPSLLLRTLVLGLSGLILILSFLLVTKWKKCRSLKSLKNKNDNLIKLENDFLKKVKNQEKLISNQNEQLKNKDEEIYYLKYANKTLLTPPITPTTNDNVQKLKDLWMNNY